MASTLTHWALEALSLVLLLSAPALAAALGAGLVMGLLQGATSVQDPTLSFVPRLFAVAAALAAAAAWMGRELVEFTRELWSHLALMGG